MLYLFTVIPSKTYPKNPQWCLYKGHDCFNVSYTYVCTFVNLSKILVEWSISFQFNMLELLYTRKMVNFIYERVRCLMFILKFELW